MGKARPAAAGIKFVGRAEQGFAADDVHINAGFEQVVVFMTEGVFSRAVLGNLVLLFGQEAFEFGSAGFFIRCRVKAFALRGGFGFARQRFVGFADIDVAVAVGVFNQIVLMVFLGVVEVFQRLVFDDEGKFVFLLLNILPNNGNRCTATTTCKIRRRQAVTMGMDKRLFARK